MSVVFLMFLYFYIIAFILLYAAQSHFINETGGM